MNPATEEVLCSVVAGACLSFVSRILHNPFQKHTTFYSGRALPVVGLSMQSIGVHQWVLVIVPFASNSARDLCAYDALARAYRLVFGFPNGSSHRDGLSRIVSSLLYLVHSYRLYTSILDTHVCGLLNNAF